MSTLQSSVKAALESGEKRRIRKHRHHPRSRASAPSMLDVDYQTQFPSLTSTNFILDVAVSPAPQWSYSEIAARQFVIAPMTSDISTSESVASQFIPASVPNVSRRSLTRNLTHAVRTWLPVSSVSASSAIATSNRPSRPSISSQRTQFDKLFASRKPLPVEVEVTTKQLKETNKFESVSKLRFSLAQVNNTRLLLPDYLLDRLIKTNPTFFALINQSKSASVKHKAQHKRNDTKSSGV
jgi:hypothetical protein